MLLSSCGKSNPATNKDAAMGGLDAGGLDAGGLDAGSVDTGTLAACLEQPGTPARPANGRLPCELIPPGSRF